MVLGRLKKYIDEKGITIAAFERSIGMSNASFGKNLKSGGAIGSDKLEKILSTYSDLNPVWLMTGEGEMLKRNFETKSTENAYLDNVGESVGLNTGNLKVQKTPTNETLYPEHRPIMVVRDSGPERLYDAGVMRDPRDVELLASKDAIIERDAKLIAALEQRIDDLKKSLDEGLGPARPTSSKAAPGAHHPRI